MVSCSQIRASRRRGNAPGGRREQSLTRLFRQAAALALLGALSACGGGATPAPASAPPAPAPSGPLAAVMSVPTPVGYDADRLAAFNRLNEIRLSAGLGMVAQQTQMDRAAQAHADWEVANNVYGHVEAAGTTGFTGAHWWDRDMAFGYTPVAGEEVATTGNDPIAAVNGFTNVAYHRIAILSIELVDVGIGRSSQPGSGALQPVVVDLAIPDHDAVRGQGQLAQASTGGVVIWPIDGARDVATHMGNEFPNPVSGSNVLTLGTPVSITVASTRTLSVSSLLLTNRSTGVPVPTALLTHLNDPNNLVPTSYVAAIPLTPLDANAAYEVEFEGKVLAPDTGAATALSRTWRFATGPV